MKNTSNKENSKITWNIDAQDFFDVIANPIRRRIINLLVNYGILLTTDLTRLFKAKNHIKIKRHLDYMYNRKCIYAETPNRYITVYTLNKKWKPLLSRTIKDYNEDIFSKDLKDYSEMDTRVAKDYTMIIDKLKIDLTKEQKDNNELLVKKYEERIKKRDKT